MNEADRHKLWQTVDGMSYPLYQIRGAVNVLFDLCDVVDKGHAAELAFIAEGLGRQAKVLEERYDAASELLKVKPSEGPSGPRLVNDGDSA